MEAAKAIGKVQPARSNNGKAINKIREGNTSQKMPRDRLAILEVSPVSAYSQRNANTDVSGSEARIAAKSVLRLAASLMATTSTLVRRTLMMVCSIRKWFQKFGWNATDYP